jgi:hypothetical protein
MGVLPATIAMAGAGDTLWTVHTTMGVGVDEVPHVSRTPNSEGNGIVSNCSLVSVGMRNEREAQSWTTNGLRHPADWTVLTA